MPVAATNGLLRTICNSESSAYCADRDPRTEAGAMTTAPALDRPSRLTRLRRSLTPGEWRAIAGMASVVVLLHVVGWVTLAAIVAPQHYDVGGSQIFGIGLGLTAYTLGMRHAFDADHIAAIDNTTRKLMAEGK